MRYNVVIRRWGAARRAPDREFTVSAGGIAADE